MSGNFILTSDGQRFYADKPHLHRYDIKVIAAALAKLCRFTGHTRKFYSVAEHSVFVSELVPKDLALYGLLHDAHEAFIGDIPTPWKRELFHAADAERSIDFEIFRAFKLEQPSPAVKNWIKQADAAMLRYEVHSLMPPGAAAHFGFTPVSEYEDWVSLECLSPDAAEAMFLVRFAELTGA